MNRGLILHLTCNKQAEQLTLRNLLIEQSTITMASKKNEIPSLMNFWGGLYAAVPKIYIPGTKFDVGFILLFSMVFSCIRLASEYFVDNFTSFDIADQRSKDIAAYIASASRKSSFIIKSTPCSVKNPFHVICHPYIIISQSFPRLHTHGTCMLANLAQPAIQTIRCSRYCTQILPGYSISTSIPHDCLHVVRLCLFV